MDRLEELITIIRQAGDILIEHRKRGFETATKSGPYDFVTTADTASDVYLRQEVSRLFPADKILSEENGEMPDDYMGRVWMIDPLDGTRAFVDGSDSFSVIIGLAIDGVPTLGVLYAPLRDELYYAEKGAGAYLRREAEEKRIHVSRVSLLMEARSVGYRRYAESRPLDIFVDQLGLRVVATEGTNTLKIGKIAQGVADVVINTSTTVSKWDFCAPQILLEEAGGAVTDIEGKAIDYLAAGNALNKSVVATNGILHDSVIRALQAKMN